MSYFSPLLPTIITGPGTYRTRSGEVVTIDTVPQRPSIVYCDCVGRYSSGVIETWNSCGRIFTGRETNNDIITKES